MWYCKRRIRPNREHKKQGKDRTFAYIEIRPLQILYIYAEIPAETRSHPAPYQDRLNNRFHLRFVKVLGKNCQWERSWSQVLDC